MCAWIVVDLDGTLVHPEGEIPPEAMEMGTEGELPPEAGGMDPSQMGMPPPMMPMEGAVEAMMQLAAEGHRLTVYTSRFAPMPDSEKQRLKEQIETELAQSGFPPMEVWTGTTKPDSDIFIDDKAVTFDGDWGLALAQTQVMLEEAGLAPALQQGMDEEPTGEPMQEEEFPPEEEAPPQEEEVPQEE